MRFTGIGILCVIICGILMFCQWKYLIRLLIISAPFQGLAVVNANGFGLTLFMFVEICVIAKCIFQNICGNKGEKLVVTKKEILPLAVFLIWSLMVSVIFSHFFSFDTLGGKTTPLNKIVIISIRFLCFSVIHTKVKIEDYDYISNSIYMQLVIVLLLGYYGYFANKIGISLEWLMKFIDNNESYNSLYWQMGRFHVPFLEPSMCGGYLSPVFWCMVAINRRESRILALITLLALILNVSTTGIVTFMAGYFMFLVLRNNRTYWKYTILIIMVLVIAFGNEEIRKLFIDMTVNKMDSVSGVSRSHSDIEAVKISIKSFGIGIGFVNSRASSLITTLLVSTGVIGCLSYIIFCLRCVSWKRIKSQGEIAGFSIALLLTLVAQAVSIPDINYPIYWMFVYVLDMAKKNERNNLEGILCNR